ncbi:MAG TPA: cyclic nucleotide-binding domain-containing protein [Bacteroidota bacterium]|nr:cyclic nucleotide-binding domain-containing protein [Bacteroidota bacterium]
MENLEGIIRDHQFLKGLDQNTISLVAGCAANVRFDPNQLLFREGEEANAFYIIRQGKIAVEVYGAERGPIIIDTLGEGDILGWSWLIPPFHWHFDARAVDLTRAIALDGRCLRTKCESDHNLGYELLKRFAQVMEDRLQATRIRLLDLYAVKS